MKSIHEIAQALTESNPELAKALVENAHRDAKVALARLGKSFRLAEQSLNKHETKNAAEAVKMMLRDLTVILNELGYDEAAKSTNKAAYTLE